MNYEMEIVGYPMFKKGDLVMCVNPFDGNTTKGRKYVVEIMSENSGVWFVHHKLDDGVQIGNSRQERFVKVRRGILI